MDDSGSDLDIIAETNYDDSDVDENDKFGEEDIFNDKNLEYKKASAFPVIPCPTNDNAKNYEYIILNQQYQTA
jgi:hypothetical protein